MLRQSSSVTKAQQEYEHLSQLGFTVEQITLLLRYRVRYRTGYYQRDPAVDRRLEFARWLYQQGKMSEHAII
jgi:hypothetical protein